MRLALANACVVIAAGVVALAVPTTIAPDAVEGTLVADATARLGELAREPRPLGSRAHTSARASLLGVLAHPRLTVETVAREASRVDGAMLSSARVHNVVARLSGARHDRRVVFVAHYDSVPGSPGASDDGAGVAAIATAARALAAGPQLPQDAVFVLSDGEESGLLGAQALVDAGVLTAPGTAVVNFEARGNRGPMLLFETGAADAVTLRWLRASGLRVAASSAAAEVYRYMPNGSDFGVLRTAGFAGANFAAIGGADAYHGRGDTAAAIDPRLVAFDVDAVMRLARTPLDDAPTDGDRAAFFDIGGALVSYGNIAALVLALVATAGLAAAVHALRRREGLRLGRACLAAAANIGGALAAFALATGFTLACAAIDPSGLGTLAGDAAHTPTSFAVALLLGAIAACAASRVASGTARLVGLGALWIALAWAGTLALPGLGHLFLAGLLVLGADAAARVWPARCGLVIAALAARGLAAVLWLPLLWWMTLGLGPDAPPVVATLAALAFGPVLVGLAELPRRWWPEAGGAAAAVIAAAIELLAPAGDPPYACSAIWIGDVDANRAVWATEDAYASGCVRDAADTREQRWVADRLGDLTEAVSTRPAPATSPARLDARWADPARMIELDAGTADMVDLVVPASAAAPSSVSYDGGARIAVPPGTRVIRRIGAPRTIAIETSAASGELRLSALTFGAHPAAATLLLPSERPRPLDATLPDLVVLSRTLRFGSR